MQPCVNRPQPVPPTPALRKRGLCAHEVCGLLGVLKWARVAEHTDHTELLARAEEAAQELEALCFFSKAAVIRDLCAALTGTPYTPPTDDTSHLPIEIPYVPAGEDVFHAIQRFLSQPPRPIYWIGGREVTQAEYEAAFPPHED